MRKVTIALVLVVVPAVCFAYLAVPRVGGLNTTNPAEGLPTAVYVNPAAMGLISGNEAFFDLTPTYFLASFQRAGENPYTGEPYEECGFGALLPIPFLGAVFTPGIDWLRAGAAFLVPNGRITYWPDNGAQRYQLTELMIMDLAFSVAASVKVTQGFWIGGAFEPRYVVFDTSRSLDFADYTPALTEELLGIETPEDIVPPQLPEWEGRLSVSSGGFAFGWSAGALVVPIHWIKLGLTYHAPVHVETEGDFELTVPDKPLALFGLMNFEGGVQQMLEDLVGVEAPSVMRGTAKLSFDLPQSVVAGVQIGPVKKWRVLLSAAWVDWSVYDEIEAQLEPENSDLEMPKDKIVTKNIPSWVFGFVVAREHRQKDLWGFGVNYETDSIPEKYAAVYNVNAPQLDFMGFYRWQMNPKMALGFGASYIYWFPKEAEESEIDRMESATGTYNVNVFRLGVNLDVAF